MYYEDATIYHWTSTMILQSDCQAACYAYYISKRYNVIGIT